MSGRGWPEHAEGSKIFDKPADVVLRNYGLAAPGLGRGACRKNQTFQSDRLDKMKTESSIEGLDTRSVSMQTHHDSQHTTVEAHRLLIGGRAFSRERRR